MSVQENVLSFDPPRALVRSDTLSIQATGLLAINNGFNDVLQQDLRRAETVSAASSELPPRLRKKSS